MSTSTLIILVVLGVLLFGGRWRRLLLEKPTPAHRPVCSEWRAQFARFLELYPQVRGRSLCCVEEFFYERQAVRIYTLGKHPRTYVRNDTGPRVDWNEIASNTSAWRNAIAQFLETARELKQYWRWAVVVVISSRGSSGPRGD
jgi:hypothetical protein